MNTYKFRGKSISTGQWIYGFLGRDRESLAIISDAAGRGNDVYPETVGLCSPFTEQNGKDICQGDRVKITWRNESWVPKEYSRTGTVVFEKGCFLFVEDGSVFGARGTDGGFWCALTDPIDDGAKVEVIGNVYEEANETK